MSQIAEPDCRTDCRNCRLRSPALRHLRTVALHISSSRRRCERSGQAGLGRGVMRMACAGSNITIAGRPSHSRSHSHFQVRYSRVRPLRHSQVRPERLGCWLRHHSARNQIEHRAGERNDHARPVASCAAGARTALVVLRPRRKRRCRTFHPVCSAPSRDQQNYPQNPVSRP
jgi:hypothetical protein